MPTPFVPTVFDQFIIEAVSGRPSELRGVITRVETGRLVTSMSDAAATQMLTPGVQLRVRFVGRNGTFTGICRALPSNSTNPRVLEMKGPTHLDPGYDRREFVRVPVIWDCRLRHRGGLWEKGRTIDVSGGGVQVKTTPDNWLVSSEIDLLLSVPGILEPIGVGGRVTHVFDPGRFGVAFIEISKKQQEQIIGALLVEEQRQAADRAQQADCTDQPL